MCLKLYLPKDAVLSLDQGSTATVNYVCVLLCVRAWGIFEVKMRRWGSFGHRRLINTPSREEKSRSPYTGSPPLAQRAQIASADTAAAAKWSVYTLCQFKFTIR